MLKRLGVVVAIVALLGTVVPNSIAQNKNRNLVVITRNMDTGSDYKFVLNAKTPLEVVVAVAATYQEILASNIPERADAIAAEIQARQPDLVALQEVTTVMSGPSGGPATKVDADQLQALTAALQLRGLHYAPLAVQQNSDLEFPAYEALSTGSELSASELISPARTTGTSAIVGPLTSWISGRLFIRAILVSPILYMGRTHSRHFLLPTRG